MIGALRRDLRAAVARGETTLATEMRAGLATFLAMAYIIVVNPAILEAAGLPREASVTATILSAIVGTLLMGLYARRPFAVAPYMGENAFIAFTVVQGMGISWQVALGAICLAGIVFALLTVLRIRAWLADALPRSLTRSFAVGIGFFITFIGLTDLGIVRVGIPGAPVALGDLTAPATALGLGGVLLTTILTVSDFPRPGVSFKDITPVLHDPALFLRTTTALAAPWQSAGITHVLAIESRGFLFGAPVAQHLGAALVPVRKPGKLPRARLTESYALEYGTDTLECHVDALGAGDRALVIDDVLATGGTAAAVVRLVARTGATLAGIAAVIDLSFLPWRTALMGVRTETLVRY